MLNAIKPPLALKDTNPFFYKLSRIEFWGGDRWGDGEMGRWGDRVMGSAQTPVIFNHLGNAEREGL